MTPDEYHEELSKELVNRIDRETLALDFSPRDAAQIYRWLVSDFRDRAAGLEREAEANGE